MPEPGQRGRTQDPLAVGPTRVQIPAPASVICMFVIAIDMGRDILREKLEEFLKSIPDYHLKDKSTKDLFEDILKYSVDIFLDREEILKAIKENTLGYYRRYGNLLIRSINGEPGKPRAVLRMLIKILRYLKRCPRSLREVEEDLSYDSKKILGEYYKDPKRVTKDLLRMLVKIGIVEKVGRGMYKLKKNILKENYHLERLLFEIYCDAERYRKYGKLARQVYLG